MWPASAKLGTPEMPSWRKPESSASHLRGALLRGEKGSGILEPRFRRDFGQHRPIADVAPVLEVGAEQALDHRILPRRTACLAGTADQAMRIHGVRGAPLPIEAELQPRGRAGRGDLRVEFARTLEAAEFRRAIGGALHALAGHVGVELEGAPMHLEAPARVAEPREGAFQVPLADPAPRADGIGNHVDARGGRGARGARRRFRARGGVRQRHHSAAALAAPAAGAAAPRAGVARARPACRSSTRSRHAAAGSSSSSNSNALATRAHWNAPKTM